MDISVAQLNAALKANAGVDPAAVSRDAAQRFEALMQAGPTAPPAHPGEGQPNAVASIAHAQDAAIQRVSNDALWLGNNIGTLSVDRVFAAATLVQVETASLTVDMQVKMATVTASKDALSTLMKNQ